MQFIKLVSLLSALFALSIFAQPVPTPEAAAVPFPVISPVARSLSILGDTFLKVRRQFNTGNVWDNRKDKRQFNTGTVWDNLKEKRQFNTGNVWDNRKDKRQFNTGNVWDNRKDKI